MKFEIFDEVFEVLPDACFGVVYAEGIDNQTSKEAITAFLTESIATCEARYSEAKVKEDPDIVCYREAFRKLGINPNKFMCSIEALLSRVAKGKRFPKINPVVDLGNAVSLKYGLPIGAHDAATVQESLCVRYAAEGDTFIPFGGTEPEPLGGRELVYVSGHEVRTRNWTWRQSEVGKITGETNSVLFPIDGFLGINDGRVREARGELAKRLAEIFGCKVEEGFIDHAHSVFTSK